MLRTASCGVLGVVLAAATATSALAKDTTIRIGTGGETGVYYPTGSAICRLVNRNTEDHGVTCLVEATGGSVYNLKAIRDGRLDFGIAQSDWQFHSLNGTSRFEDDMPFDDLRAVFSLHPEAFTVVARADSDIATFEDLAGKRVNIGNAGSGSRGTMETLMSAKGMTLEDFALATELKPSQQVRAVCDNEIDAMVFAVGHPSAAIRAATTECDTRLVDVSGPEVAALISDNPYYRTATIPGGMYDGNPDDTATFGVGAALVTSADVSQDVVYVVVKAVFDSLDKFREMHPALEILKEDEMKSQGMSAPVHKGAQKFYAEDEQS
ncbi:TAXI family TRAP transporter solute-binding subunit [Roseivivax sp. CAU 1753]